MRDPDLSLESDAWAAGYRRVAGIDEAGRGAWAGPVVAAAVMLPIDRVDLRDRLAGVRDSKMLTARGRERMFDLVQREALAIGVGISPTAMIIEQGIVAATRQAMGRAVEAMHLEPDYLLIDYLQLPQVTIPQRGVTRGDQKSYSIAAASIIAKVSRDRMMADLACQYPVYGFDRHKGYGTKNHREALQLYGTIPSHRTSWAPFQALLNCPGGETL